MTDSSPKCDKVSTSGSTLDDLPIASFWLNLCRAYHPKCNTSVSPGFTPTRLVDLTSSRPRLRTFLTGQPGVGYATLSHCWGVTRRPVLTESELDLFHDYIPTAALSKTFLDAINVAKHIGLYFIWIDSLCIIQDSIDDWRQEAATMSDVYRNSELNISAAGAADGTDGCFFDRKDDWKCEISMGSGERTARYLCLPFEFEIYSLDDMPLMKRAWVLQERLLAPRTLHFAKSQLFWECNELHACRLLPHGYDNWGRNTKIQRTGDIRDALRKWKSIVTEYSMCKLTKDKDKLIAISGIARVMRAKS